MARQVLGGLTTLNLATNLDPMFAELYDASFLNALNTVSIGPNTGTGQRALILSGGTGASDGGVVVFRRGSTDSILIGDHGRVFGTGAGDGVFSVAGAFNQRFYTNGSERVRIDSAGNVGIGIAPSFRLETRGPTGTQAYFRDVTTGGYCAVVTDANGPMLTFGNGSIGWRLADGSTERLRCDTTTGHFGAGADNVQTWGQASRRWSVVYAGTGSINTSDAREKTKVASLTERELAAAKQLSKEIGAFKFIASVDAKGDDARIHIGMTVQRAIEVMREHDLDPFAYAFICYDEWEAVEHPADFKTEERDTGLINAAGNAITETIKTEIKPAYTTPAGNRYGFRVDQLNLFIARGLAARLDDLESGSATA